MRQKSIFDKCCGFGSGPGESLTEWPPGSESVNSELRNRIRIRILTVYQSFEKKKTTLLF
jgi:hypothetical protein